MRKRAEVKQQLKQVTFRHLQKRLRDNFKRRPDSCRHNRQVVLDEDDGTVVHLCGHMDDRGIPRNVVCDSRVPGCDDMARECPLWCALRSKQEVKDEFNEVVHSGSRGLIASEFPDIAALMWVLDDPDGVGVPSEDEQEAALDEDEDPEPPTAGWTLRGWLKNLGGS